MLRLPSSSDFSDEWETSRPTGLLALPDGIGPAGRLAQNLSRTDIRERLSRQIKPRGASVRSANSHFRGNARFRWKTWHPAARPRVPAAWHRRTGEANRAVVPAVDAG